MVLLFCLGLASIATVASGFVNHSKLGELPSFVTSYASHHSCRRQQLTFQSFPCLTNNKYRSKSGCSALSSSLRQEANDFQSRHPHIEFVSPLIEDGYPPAVKEYQQRLTQHTLDGSSSSLQSTKRKPLLLYLPGFDGTILAPFIQFPSLGESFDVRGMRVGMEDRSTFDELKSIVLDYLSSQCDCGTDKLSCEKHEEVYLMGESFGGILAIEVARELRSRPEYSNIQLKGLTLVNPATSYLRSSLYSLGPPVANRSTFFPPITFLQYVSSLTGELVPLFLDRGMALQQLTLMLSSKALPIVLNSPQREAYLGRVAFDLANRLKFMPQNTLKWRLEEWLERGATLFEDRLEMTKQNIDSDEEGLLSLKGLNTLIVVGELDLTLPSVEEAHRLASEVFDSARIHVVRGAGHASTCGGSLQLIRLMRDLFPDLEDDVAGTSYDQPSDPELMGLVPRYDNAPIGMSPLNYWKRDYFQRIDNLNE
ncbi:hypothetical protein HJC23_001667 [Cyclotella cryptica]|uniref:AB hydrolase-1 domain-containing protein n=1 Tax=Cyclotella cryptica TaxID=29204 RepID=A0ABD3QKA4_9STRA|eukprot:CCRYP_004684-RB/>CCRYP_004684-RB protein AED:0.01 eAED:0.01 QI:308/-1/1/1/-1/1/1/244/480